MKLSKNLSLSEVIKSNTEYVMKIEYIRTHHYNKLGIYQKKNWLNFGNILPFYGGKWIFHQMSKNDPWEEFL